MSSEVASGKQWERCLEVIKCNVKDHEFQTWFNPIEFISFERDKKELLLGVQSNYFFEMLDGPYKQLIYNVVWRIFGQDARIAYRIQTDSTNNIAIQVEGESAAVKKQRLSKDNTFKKLNQKTTDEELDSQLNKDYRFDNFIEGESNKLPRSIGQSIAENPTQGTFNPLFIYGSSGVGKTHLVNAIGLRIKELHPSLRVLYVGAHQFEVQFTDSRRNNNFNDFIHFYQTIDVLIIDDIQELALKEGTQLAFFHIFNHLKMNGKQIILTSDRHPASMKGMEERLLTRFKWGLTTELEKPNHDLCKKILLSKIRRDGLTISEDVVDYVAENANESVRDLEGIVNSLMAYSVVYNRDIDIEMAEQVVRRTLKYQVRNVTLEAIIEAVCTMWNVTQEDIFSKSRKAHIVQARQTAMCLAQKHTKLTVSKIGLHIGGRNHATVLHAIKQVKDRMAIDKNFAQQVSEIESQLKA
ncbi:MAG: chromosomal replication initiator protein DnaA [Bacteroidaceae bacterium]|nr:chromosomal replication initiator protein DnaA [Bacteroidaceae bacterium]